MNTTQKKNNKPFVLLGFAFFVITFGLGVLSGRLWGVQVAVSNDEGNVEIQKVINLYSKSRSPEVDFNQFWQVWNTIKSRHVEQPVDDVKLFYGALAGMVKGLDDPYSIYFPPRQAEEFARDLAGEFDGIGAEIGIKNGQLIVVTPLPSSPAEQAGLKAQDRILAIDGEETQGLSIDQAVLLIRGEQGTKVVLTVFREGSESVEDIEITRDVINIPTVTFEMQDDNIAYLRVSYFNDETWGEFDKAVKEIVRKNVKGIILDLRSNPGGFLDTSIQVASEWIPEGVVVKEKMSDGTARDYETVGKHRLAGIPTVVLVDKGSASGSEIVAGALRDHNAGQLVGIQTFGKGSVQDLKVLPDGSALKLTIAKWLTPSEQQIDGEGIVPDVIIEEMFTEEEVEEGEEKSFKDNGMERAREILLSKN